LPDNENDALTGDEVTRTAEKLKYDSAMSKVKPFSQYIERNKVCELKVAFSILEERDEQRRLKAL